MEASALGFVRQADGFACSRCCGYMGFNLVNLARHAERCSQRSKKAPLEISPLLVQGPDGGSWECIFCHEVLVMPHFNAAQHAAACERLSVRSSYRRGIGLPPFFSGPSW